MKKIKISIIIPVYNTSKYLKRCLNSIITQSLKEVEIIIVNDGSTDNSLEILEFFREKDNRIILLHQENKGLTSARNYGINSAIGEYILHIDSDDWIEPNYLTRMYEKAKKDNLDVVISNIVVDYEGECKSFILNDLNLTSNEKINGKEYIEIFLKNNFCGYTWNKLVKKEIYVNNFLKFNEKIFFLEDTEFTLRMAYHAKNIGKLNEAYYHYVQRGNNGSKIKKVKHLEDQYLAFESLISFFKVNEENRLLKLLLERRDLSFIAELIIYDWFKIKEAKDIMKKMIIKMQETPKTKFNDIKYPKKWKLMLKILKKLNLKYGLEYIKLLNILYKGIKEIKGERYVN